MTTDRAGSPPQELIGHSVSWQPQRAPNVVPFHFERCSPRQTTLRRRVCGQHLLMSSNCKRRGFRPQRGSRRMSHAAAHVLDQAFGTGQKRVNSGHEQSDLRELQEFHFLAAGSRNGELFSAEIQKSVSQREARAQHAIGRRPRYQLRVSVRPDCGAAVEANGTGAVRATGRRTCFITVDDAVRHARCNLQYAVAGTAAPPQAHE